MAYAPAEDDVGISIGQLEAPKGRQRERGHLGGHSLDELGGAANTVTLIAPLAALIRDRGYTSGPLLTPLAGF